MDPFAESHFQLQESNFFFQKLAAVDNVKKLRQTKELIKTKDKNVSAKATLKRLAQLDTYYRI
jgi:hypothetical protein